MNAARAAVVMVIACAGVAIPATSAHAEEPLVCGVLTPCDEPGGDGSGDSSEPAPADDGAEVNLGLGPDFDTGVDLGAELGPDAGAGVGVELFPDSGTVLTADGDVDNAATQVGAADHRLDSGTGSALDTDATIGNDGIVVTGNGTSTAQSGVTTWRRIAGVDAANQFCGVQIVIGASSSQTCEPSAATGGGAGSEGLSAVTESFDVCGAHVVVAGSASTDCGESSAGASPAAGSSSTLADGAAAGTLCGPSIALAGESNTACAASESPVPGADPAGSGTGTPGTGTTGTSAIGTVGGAGSSPAVGGQAVQALADEPSEGSNSNGSGGSLPLTGSSVLLLLTIAIGSIATGSILRSSSWTRMRHQM